MDVWGIDISLLVAVGCGGIVTEDLECSRSGAEEPCECAQVGTVGVGTCPTIG